jgi:hypothetical protein
LAPVSCAYSDAEHEASNTGLHVWFFNTGCTHSRSIAGEEHEASNTGLHVWFFNTASDACTHSRIAGEEHEASNTGSDSV